MQIKLPVKNCNKHLKIYKVQWGPLCLPTISSNSFTTGNYFLYSSDFNRYLFIAQHTCA